MREFTPASRLAAGLMPTDSIITPSAVLRVRIAAIANMNPAIRIDAGTANQ